MHTFLRYGLRFRALGEGVRIRSSLALAAAGLLVAAALGGCVASGGTSAQMALYDGPGLDEITYGAPQAVNSVARAPRARQSDGQAGQAAVEPQSYYVEFRARAGPVFHTYMVYGPLNARGEPLEENFVGFHPKGGALGLAVGSAPIPVPGQLDKVWSDEHLPVLASYRASLGPEQYRNMVAFIEQERRKTKYWNLWVYNCNSFAAELAWAAGLQAPEFPAVIPPIWVAGLVAMNEGGPMPDMMAASAASWTPSRTPNERRRFDN